MPQADPTLVQHATIQCVRRELVRIGQAVELTPHHAEPADVFALRIAAALEQQICLRQLEIEDRMQLRDIVLSLAQCEPCNHRSNPDERE